MNQLDVASAMIDNAYGNPAITAAAIALIEIARELREMNEWKEAEMEDQAMRAIWKFEEE
jgi:hypothetical protein